MLATENPMCAQRFRALIGEEAMHGGSTDSKASDKAEVRAGSGCLGSEEARGVSQGEMELFVLCLNGEPY